MCCFIETPMSFTDIEPKSNEALFWVSRHLHANAHCNTSLHVNASTGFLTCGVAALPTAVSVLSLPVASGSAVAAGLTPVPSVILPTEAPWTESEDTRSCAAGRILVFASCVTEVGWVAACPEFAKPCSRGSAAAAAAAAETSFAASALMASAAAAEEAAASGVASVSLSATVAGAPKADAADKGADPSKECSDVLPDAWFARGGTSEKLSMLGETDRSCWSGLHRLSG